MTLSTDKQKRFEQLEELLNARQSVYDPIPEKLRDPAAFQEFRDWQMEMHAQRVEQQIAYSRRAAGKI